MERWVASWKSREWSADLIRVLRRRELFAWNCTFFCEWVRAERLNFSPYFSLYFSSYFCRVEYSECRKRQKGHTLIRSLLRSLAQLWPRHFCTSPPWLSKKISRKLWNFHRNPRAFVQSVSWREKEREKYFFSECHFHIEKWPAKNPIRKIEVLNSLAEGNRCAVKKLLTTQIFGHQIDFTERRTYIYFQIHST